MSMTVNYDYATDLAKRVRAAREAKGLSLRETAAKADISASYLSDIERGISIPSVDKMSRLAAAIGVSLARLLPS